MTQWLVIGRGGQLATALAQRLQDKAVFLGLPELDLSNLDQIPTQLLRHNPAVVINATAYTQVDKAESEPELARRINAEAVGVMAQFCVQKDIPFVHVSTDYVFDGSGTHARIEDEPTNPLNVYGATKLEGEQLIAASGCRHLIFRTSWVYDESGKNFLNTMLRLGAERETLSVVSDQVGAPTYAPHLADVMLESLKSAIARPQFPSGIYHATGTGETSWHGFACEIFRIAKAHGAELTVKEVKAIASAAYPTPTARPLNSRLSCAKLKATFDVEMPKWQDSLRVCMENKYEGR